MDLPTAVLLVVLVALGVVIVIVLEQRLGRLRRRQRASRLEAMDARPASPAPDPPRHVLMQRDIELAALVTRDREPPWLDCTFLPKPGFEQVRPLFDRELELLQHAGGTFDKAAFVEQWQRIFAAGLWIREDPGGTHVSQFLLHIHADGTARLRYG